MIDRRTFMVTSAIGILALALAAEAQTAGKVYRIGLLVHCGPAVAGLVQVFRRSLQDLGYVEGRNLLLEVRLVERHELLPDAAAELIRLGVNVIAAGSTLPGLAAKRATSTIPIVLVASADPVHRQSPAIDADLVAMGGYPRSRCVRLIDGDRIVRLGRAIVLDEYGGRARSRHELAHETLVRRKISEHPASAVKEHEHRKRAGHADWAYDHDFQGLPLTADGPPGDVRLREVDLDVRLKTFQRRAGLLRGHLLDPLASTGREGLQKDADVALDSGTSGWMVHHAGVPLCGGTLPMKRRVRGRLVRVFVPA
jgi:nucleotide-binding universal stress UspA family protein